MGSTDATVAATVAPCTRANLLISPEHRQQGTSSAEEQGLQIAAVDILLALAEIPYADKRVRAPNRHLGLFSRRLFIQHLGVTRLQNASDTTTTTQALNRKERHLATTPVARLGSNL